MNRDDVLRAIELAFEGARIPRTEHDLAEPSIESKYVVEHFFGKTREDIESAYFPASLYMEDFTYMTDAAVLYYLPSVLRIQLKTNDDELWIFLRGFLRSIKGAALTGLGVAQRNAIADWAELLSSQWASSSWMASCSKEATKLARTYRSAD